MELNVAIAAAERANVSAKYGKKCRKKLNLGLQVLQSNPEVPLPQDASEGASEEGRDTPAGQHDCSFLGTCVSPDSDSLHAWASLSGQVRVSLCDDGDSDYEPGLQQHVGLIHFPVLFLSTELHSSDVGGSFSQFSHIPAASVCQF